MRTIPFILIFILSTLAMSCSDAEVVSGTFHGKMYYTDTVEADLKVSVVNDGIIRLDITGPAINGGFVEYAQLKKNADNAYGMTWYSGSSNNVLELSGYYYDGYISYDSWTHQYKFGGQKN